MGKFDFEIPTDFIKQLGKLADVDRIAPQMIEEAIPILEKNVKSEVSKHKRTGALANSVKKTKANKNKYGYYASVRPTGLSKTYMDDKGVVRTRKKPVRNMEILVYLEYGKSGQEARPTLTKAIKDSEKAVLDKMQEVFSREVGR